MSGSSTLRICLAAMAPALTEVTARLKLQDSSVNRESLPPRLENNSTVSKIPPVPQRSCQVISVDLKALGGIKTPKVEDRPASHLSHTVKRNGAHPDPKRTAVVADNKRNTHFSCTVGSSHTLTNIKVLNIAAAHSIVKENPGGFRANQLIDNLRIMNQPQIVADKPVEQDKAEVNPSSFGEGCVSASSSIKFAIKTPSMVNGTNEFTRSSDAELDVNCMGKRQVQLKKESQSQEDHKIQCTATSTQTNASSKEMGMCLQNTSTYAISGVESSSKSETQVMDKKAKEDLRKECGKKLAYLERKVDVLLRRLKRMKGKVVEAHTREQLKCFVNFQHKNLQKVAKTIKNEAPGPDELKEHFLSSDEVKNMSTAQLVRLVKTYQPNQSASAGDVSSKKWPNSAVVMDSTLREESLRTSERLAQRVEAAAAELDSDATASSSGGESGDDDRLSPSQHPADLPPLARRAEWKWAVDRSAVVSRWTWLQAQVSDLEYRIRQQSQVHRQLRNSKGGVVLGDQPTAVELFRKLHGMPSRHVGSSGSDVKSALDSEVSPCNISAVMSNVDRQASRLSQSLGNCLSPASSTIGSPAGSSKISSPFVNGITDSPSSSSATCGTAESSPSIPTELWLKEKTSDLFEHISTDASCQAARCRPLRSYRKRKILRTIGLYKTSLKAARLSDIRCRCYPPANPCPICGGRYNNTLTIDPDTMSMKERVAILDPSFHPVLSFPHDIQLSIHCEGLLKSGLWQKSLSRRSKVDFRKQKVLTLVSEPPKKGQNRGQNRRNNTSVINFSTKIKNKYETKKSKPTGSKATAVKPRVNKVKKKAAKAARAMKKNQPEEEDDDLDYLEADYTARDGGLAGSATQSSLKDIRDIPHRKRKVDTSFDINNIVIPLSMAASTRVEQPQYKEIVTPKWREVSEVKTSAELIDSSITKKLEKTNGVTLPAEPQKLNTSLEEEAEEDLSDDRFSARHHSLEQEEKKRFRNFVQYPPVRRSRARLESISAAVPCDKQMSIDRADAGEPALTQTSLGEDSYFPFHPTPPVWNKSHQPLHMQSPGVDDSMDLLQHQLSVRRRTTSFSKRDRGGSVASEDVHNAFIDVGGVEPWPRRTFPLSEDDYRLMQDDLPPSCEPVHHRVPRRLAEPSGKVYVGGSIENMDDGSAVPSPHPSIESASSAGDELNDPEWIGGDASKRSRTRRITHEDPSDPDWTGTDTPRRHKNRR
ncbi:hypothetical protein BsWGS_25737 [Bradybaena similaris]